VTARAVTVDPTEADKTFAQAAPSYLLPLPLLVVGDETGGGVVDDDGIPMLMWGCFEHVYVLSFICNNDEGGNNKERCREMIQKSSLEYSWTDFSWDSGSGEGKISPGSGRKTNAQNKRSLKLGEIAISPFNSAHAKKHLAFYGHCNNTNFYYC
jgi:hypothetical protein